MRRLQASLLLAAISVTLIPVALLAATPDVPICCRKDGKHKCAMVEVVADDESGPSLQGVSRCPAFPSGLRSAVAGSVAGAPVPSSASEALLASFLIRAAQHEKLYHFSFNRSRQQRGPPHSV